MLRAAVLRLLSVVFYSFDRLVAQLVTADLQKRLGVPMKCVFRYDLLIIDHFGFEAIDQQSAERLHTIVDGRVGQKSTILTSNCSITD